MLCRIPTADLYQYDNRQQRGQHKPGHITFSVWRNDDGGQQWTERATEVAAHLEQRLGQTVTTPRGHTCHPRGFRMEYRRARPDQCRSHQDHLKATG
ncbi:hypothetical protein D3C78_1226890 [compost metagenome]